MRRHAGALAWLIPPLLLPGMALSLGASPPIVWACHVFSWMAVIRLLGRLSARGAHRRELVIWASLGGTVVGLIDQIALRMSPVMDRLESLDRLRGQAGTLSLYEFHHAWTGLALAVLTGVIYGALATVIYRVA